MWSFWDYFLWSGEAKEWSPRWVVLTFTCTTIQACGQLSSVFSLVAWPPHTTITGRRELQLHRKLLSSERGAALIEEGNNWFCPLRGENVSILRRSGCPPPAAGDKALLHCGCLICVTALVWVEIDVAFHRAVLWASTGGFRPLRFCLSFATGPQRVEHINKHKRDLHQYRCLALHSFVQMFVKRIKGFGSLVMKSHDLLNYILLLQWHVG